MKKLLALVLAVATFATMAIAFTSCGKEEVTYVAIDATDLLQEDFGIAVKKGDTEMKNAVNTVVNQWVNDGTMEKYIDYYTKYADYVGGVTTIAPAVPEGLKVTWDFGTATQEITVYTESGFAPFEFVAGGEVVGVDIAIMNEVAQNLGKKVVVNDGSFDLIVTNIKNATGSAVGAAGLTINEERKAEVDFSDIYYSSTLTIVSAEGKSYSKLSDLSGLKVGVQEGTSGDLIASAAKSATGYTYDDGEKEITISVVAGTEVKQYKQYSLAFQDLKNGKIDAILMDKLPALSLLKTVNN